MLAMVLLAAIGASIPQPNAKMTPGATNPALTTQRLCSHGFRTGPYRRVPAAEKRAICKAYGIPRGCPGPGYELDHLVPLEMGGANSTLNLWPQPVDRRGVIGFHTKDLVENRAAAAVCRGTLTLEDAQRGIARDWYTFGIRNGFIQK